MPFQQISSIARYELVKMCRENKQLRLMMKILAALAFVSPNLVLHYFEVLSGGIPAELEPLYDYFEDNYRGRPAGQRCRIKDGTLCDNS